MKYGLERFFTLKEDCMSIAIDWCTNLIKLTPNAAFCDIDYGSSLTMIGTLLKVADINTTNNMTVWRQVWEAEEASNHEPDAHVELGWSRSL